MSCRVLQFARFVTVQQEYGFPDTRDSLFLGLDLKLAQNFVLLIYPLTKSRTSFNFFGRRCAPYDVEEIKEKARKRQQTTTIILFFSTSIMLYHNTSNVYLQ